MKQRFSRMGNVSQRMSESVGQKPSARRAGTKFSELPSPRPSPVGREREKNMENCDPRAPLRFDLGYHLVVPTGLRRDVRSECSSKLWGGRRPFDPSATSREIEKARG